MKAISFVEFDDLVEDAKKFLQLPVKAIFFENDILALRLGDDRGLQGHLIIDVRHKVPFFIITERPLPSFQKQTKPIVLFLKAHIFGLTLSSIKRDVEYGRLIKMTFASETEDLIIEACLVPQSKNITISFKDSKISLKKPQDLPKISSFREVLVRRPVAELYDQWMEQFSRPRLEKKDESSEISHLESSLTKKQLGLNQLLENLLVLQSEAWADFAAWLNSERTDVVPPEYKDFYNIRFSIVENIDFAYAQAKKNKNKIKNLQERITNLQQEVQGLEDRVLEIKTLYTQMNSGSVTASNILREIKEDFRKIHQRSPQESPLLGVRGRTRSFDEGIKAYIGKSGTDNLKLLRQSKPWYTWVHAKDWPSAHAIIATNKDQNIPPDILSEVCLWVLKETLSEKQWASWLGIKVDFIYTQRRYLQAVKGDHHGLVRYSQAKTLTLVVRDI